MSWRLVQTFHKELARLPKAVRGRLEKLAFGNEIKKGNSSKKLFTGKSREDGRLQDVLQKAL